MPTTAGGPGGGAPGSSRDFAVSKVLKWLRIQKIQLGFRIIGGAKAPSAPRFIRAWFIYVIVGSQAIANRGLRRGSKEHTSCNCLRLERLGHRYTMMIRKQYLYGSKQNPWGLSKTGGADHRSFKSFGKLDGYTGIPLVVRRHILLQQFCLEYTSDTEFYV